jgi:hypothetical protein
MYSGGAGGGAILIVAGGTITIVGSINASGGGSGTGYWGYGGSGGAIRLIADTVGGTATAMAAVSGYASCGGGSGRIRIETNHLAISGQSNPPYTFWPIENNVPVIWPYQSDPAIRMRTAGGQTLPGDPEGRFDGVGDLLVLSSEPVPVELETTNMPLNWNVGVRVVLRSGTPYTVPATFVDGDASSATWVATLQPLPQGSYVAVQARAAQP